MEAISLALRSEYFYAPRELSKEDYVLLVPGTPQGELHYFRKVYFKLRFQGILRFSKSEHEQRQFSTLCGTLKT